MRSFFCACLWLLVCLALPARAHKPSDSYLSLRADTPELAGRWDIAVRDLDAALDLDRDRDYRINWGELRAQHAQIDRYASSRLSIARESLCTLQIGEHQIDHHSDGAYLVLPLTARCAGQGLVTIDYRALFDIDAQHRALLRLDGAGQGSSTQSAVLSAQHPQFVQQAGGTAGLMAFGGYVRDGVVHILIGYDHILFLIALLLPTVLIRDGRQWRPAQDLGATARTVIGVVTAFTLAHSVTLGLATLGVVQIPSRLTESVIALSVLLTALDNLVPFLPRRRWLVALVFGLVHGFGFASVLADLELPRSALALSLVGFNLGVELGQLAIVAVLLPLAYAARRTAGYRQGAIGIGSVAIAVLAVAWLAERSLNVKLLPF